MDPKEDDVEPLESVGTALRDAMLPTLSSVLSSEPFCDVTELDESIEGRSDGRLPDTLAIMAGSEHLEAMRFEKPPELSCFHAFSLQAAVDKGVTKALSALFTSFTAPGSVHTRWQSNKELGVESKKEVRSRRKQLIHKHYLA